MNALQKYKESSVIPTEIAINFPPKLQKEVTDFCLKIAQTQDWRTISDKLSALSKTTLTFADQKYGFPVSLMERADMQKDLKDDALNGTYYAVINEEFTNA